jgi:hypothetical protein
MMSINNTKTTFKISIKNQVILSKMKMIFQIMSSSIIKKTMKKMNNKYKTTNKTILQKNKAFNKKRIKNMQKKIITNSN